MRSHKENLITTIYKTLFSLYISDCRRGQSLVVWAINEGRQAAREIDSYLRGCSYLPGPGGVISSLVYSPVS